MASYKIKRNSKIYIIDANSKHGAINKLIKHIIDDDSVQRVQSEYNYEGKVTDKLIQSASEEALQKNIATEIKAGKDPKQAAAIAYSVQRENDEKTCATDYDYIGNAMIMKSLPKVGKRARDYNFGYQDSIIVSIEKYKKQGGYTIYKINCVDKDDMKLYKEFGDSYYYLAAIKDSAIKDNFNVEDDITSQQYFTDEIDLSEYTNNPDTKEVKLGNSSMVELSQDDQFNVKLIEALKAAGYKKKNSYQFIKDKSVFSKETMNSMQSGIEKDYSEMNSKLKNLKSNSDSASIVGRYIKIKPNGVEKANLIETSRGYTVVSSDPKDDKDFQTQGQCETYLKGRGYRIADKQFKVTYKDRNFIVKAVDTKDAISKLSSKVKDDHLSPMTYKKLKELGYTSKQWSRWNQEEANKIVAKSESTNNRTKQSSEGIESKESNSNEITNKNNSSKSFNIGNGNILHSYSGKEENVSIPENVNDIGVEAFRYNEHIKSVKLSNNTSTISEMAFANCENLEHVDLGGAIEIDSGAFSGCPNLKEITIPKSVQTINSYAFSDSGIETIKLPNSVDKLSKGAFSDCYELREIVLSNNLKEIEEDTFKNCESLTSIDIPKNVTKISKGAFENCSNLEHVNLPEGVEVEWGAFKGTAFEKNAKSILFDLVRKMHLNPKEYSDEDKRTYESLNKIIFPPKSEEQKEKEFKIRKILNELETLKQEIKPSNQYYWTSNEIKEKNRQIASLERQLEELEK